MRYVMFMIPAVYGDPTADAMPTADAVEKMMRYNADLAEAGILESLNGLHPPQAGARIAFTDEGPELVAVPAEGAVGGYWIITPDSHEEALAWARRCPAAPGDTIELRRVQDLEDFPADVQDVLESFDL